MKPNLAFEIRENMADKALLVAEIARCIGVRPGAVQAIDGSKGQPMGVRNIDEGAMLHLQFRRTLVTVKEDQNAPCRDGLGHLDPVGTIDDPTGDRVAAISGMGTERQAKKCGNRHDTFKNHPFTSRLRTPVSPTVFAQVLQFAGPSRFRERYIAHA